MNERPLVTVIMPVRNEAAYIERSLDSVLAQDYAAERIEIFIADGMSDDGTRRRSRNTRDVIPTSTWWITRAGLCPPG